MDWFRSKFPYYYDRCDHCGESYRENPFPESNDDDDEDTNQHVVCNNANNVGETLADMNDNNDEEEDDGGGTFLGYIHPNEQELVLGKAGRTELYHCHVCHKYTRFPRYNSAASVLRSQRGRCGEYSMLLYRMLRALGHHTRWVVDWADHVWAEIHLDNNNDDDDDATSWIHLDPCEAAVQQPLLYQGWGKQPTYIVGFYAPLVQPFNETKTTTTTTSSDKPQQQPLSAVHSGAATNNNNHDHVFDFVQDVTAHYTSDNATVIQNRRDDSVKVVEEAVKRIAQEHQKNVEALLSLSSLRQELPANAGEE